jgi:probable rRNA maturation factor
MPTNVKPKRGKARATAITQDSVAGRLAGAYARARNDAPATHPPRLSLSVQNAVDAEPLPATSTLRRWISRALHRDATMTVRFVGSAEGRALNRRYRGRDYPTNVLTFVYDDGGSGTPVQGDLVLCVPVLKREARAQDKTLRAHCAHLVVHGTLHLQGYDHESDKDATVMEALETRTLAALGYSDPYDETR